MNNAESPQMLHQLLEDILNINPDLWGQICFEEYGSKKSITYAELNLRANKLAQGLLKRDFTPNHDGDILIALRFLPSIDLIVTIVALSKAGLAYVPIAPNWPPGRIKILLEDSRPVAIITNTKADLLYTAVKGTEALPILQVTKNSELLVN